MKNLRKTLVLLLSLMMVSAMSITAFAYTALDDDDARASEVKGTFGVVASNSGMLRTDDNGTTAHLSADKTKIDVTVKTVGSKTWGKITKLALIETSATDEEKNAAAAGVVFDDDTLDKEGKEVSRTFHYSIPLNEIGKKIPVCVWFWDADKDTSSWKTYNGQSYYIVVWTEDLKSELETAAAAETDPDVKAGLDAAVTEGNKSLAKTELTIENPEKVMMTIKKAYLFKQNGKYKVDLQISASKSTYYKAFQGYASEADDSKAIDINTDTTEKIAYVTLPVAELGKPTVWAFKTSKYYNRTLTISEDKLVLNNTEIALDDFDNMTEEEAIARAEADTGVATVNALIGAIQSQKWTESTDKYCRIAKVYYDKLSDSDKAKVEEADYFGLYTGDASKDDPMGTAPDKTKELLVVSFGTSFNDSRVATIGAVEKALKAAFPEYAVRRAFTAQIIINHVYARDGEKIDNVKQAMDKAVAAGVKEMIVQPTHLMSGAEFDELKGEIDTYAKKIKITYAKPLLDSDADKETVAKEAVAAAAKEAGFADVKTAVADKDTAFVFMGHGTAHKAKETYTFMQQTMDKLGYANCFVGTVEGEPEATKVEEVLKRVQAGGFKKVVLRPLMVVAGDHANNDMAGDDADSWKSVFGTALGAENVACQIKGLGEISAVQKLYVAHTQAVIDAAKKAEEDKKKAEEEKKTKTAIAKVKAGKIAKFKAKAGKKKVTFTWKKNTTFSGYQLKYKAGKKTKTVTIKSAKTAKYVAKKLKKKQKVSGKIRGFKKINGKLYYGKWAKTKTVKVK